MKRTLKEKMNHLSAKKCVILGQIRLQETSQTTKTNHICVLGKLS